MSRRRAATADDITDLVALLPWWVGVILALVSYLLFSHWAAQPVTGSAEAGQVSTLAISQIKQTASSVLRYLMPLFCLMGAALSWARRNKKKRR